jgi:hypothetical protein
MGSTGFDTVPWVDPAEPARKHRAILPVVFAAAFLMLLALWGSAPALAVQSNHGLPAGVALPSWAVGKPIHFFVNHSSAGSLVHSGLGQCKGSGCPEPPLLYHAGKGVQHSPKVYVVFWGSRWNESPGTTLHTQLVKLYEGISSSAWQGILTQYFDTTGRVSSTASAVFYTDTSVTAPSSVNNKKIEEEVASAVKARGWTREFDDQFVVVPAPGSTYETSFGEGGFCGYHGVDGSGSSYTFVAYPGEAPFKAGCIKYDRNENADNVTSMIAAHEYAESATDPQVEPFANAEWYTGDGYEVADICATGDDEITSGPLKGSFVQGLWDDHLSACELYDATPPHVYAVTEPATSVKPHEATLKATANPEGLETKVYFEYGPTTSYGTNTAEVSVGSGTANREASQTVASLQLEGTYHYRLVATNSSGTTDGEDHVVTTSHWVIQSTPGPTESEASVLAGTSCTSPSACTSVGFSDEPLGFRPLAERWNGTTWSIQPTPSPKNAGFSELTGVACVSSSACTAVGSSGYPRVTLVEQWKGGEWSIQTTPSPKAEFSELDAISCSSASACTAVGISGYPIKMLAERWNGTEWSIQSTPSLGSGIEGELSSVSCASSTACTAVGRTIVSAGISRALALSWNGTEWTNREVPNPTGAQTSYLSSVSCTASTSCTAVGGYEEAGSQNSKTLAEYWNGTKWAIQSTPNPTGAHDGSNLLGVWCSSSRICTAVGSYTTTEPGAMPTNTVTLAEMWNGVEWTIDTSLNQTNGPTGGLNSLTSVSCALPEACAAVGHYQTDTSAEGMLTESVTPEWTIRSTPDPSGAKASHMIGLSCVSFGACTAVGYSVNGASEAAMLAEGWNGVEWKEQTLPTASGAKESVVEGVSCTSSSACMVVGGFLNSSSVSVPLAERWNGVKWSAEEPPIPSGAKESGLFRVSCASASACTAVGAYTNSAGTYFTLAESWNGTSWSVKETPPVVGAKFSQLAGVSCTASNACTAVGEYQNSENTFLSLAERWNGEKWSIQEPPALSGATFTWLNGVSCTSSTACTAVGYYRKTGAYLTLAERWNGTAWSVQSTPNLSGTPEDDHLEGVSCASASACTAVGTYTNSAGIGTLLMEAWNGTEWTLQSAPSPSEAKGTVNLKAVSCLSSGFCGAVGDYYKTSSSSESLNFSDIYG